MVIILMMPEKKATTDFLKKVFWNKGYDVITYVHDVTKMSSCDLNYIVDMVMWSRFSTSSISMRKVIIFFWGVALVEPRLNNLGSIIWDWH